jgi:hypothetical protein
MSAYRILKCDMMISTSFHAGVFLGLLFDPEYAGDVLLRNVGWLSTDYTVLHPRRENSL